jgi:hypothetical protein
MERPNHAFWSERRLCSAKAADPVEEEGVRTRALVLADGAVAARGEDLPLQRARRLAPRDE